jgi:hypothetical protein
MITIEEARALASKTPRPEITVGEPISHQEGWFFPYVTTMTMGGAKGVVVNKHTGKLHTLGSSYPLERDLKFYDLGYQFDRYDLVVLAIHDLPATRKCIGRLPLVIVEPKYENGAVWRMPQTMTDIARWQALDSLPCIFAWQSLWTAYEVLEEARAARWFDFEALECRVRLTTGA